MHSFSVTTENITINNISLKTKFFGLHFRYRKYWCIFNHFYVIRPESYRIRRNYAAVRAIMPFKVTDFHTNRKFICEFLLVTNINLPPTLHRFRDIAYGRSKIAIFWLPLLRLTPDGGVPLGQSP